MQPAFRSGSRNWFCGCPGRTSTLALEKFGLALLHHAFREFLQRGYKRVGLGMDSQNLSGATRLYKKAGMDITRELVVYEK